MAYLNHIDNGEFRVPDIGYSRMMRFVMVLFLSVSLSACATTTGDPGDPLEPVNRAVYQVNKQLDGMFLRPAAIMYQGAVPSPIRTGLRNFIRNLATPVILLNDLLQGETDRAAVTAQRFIVNTFVGVGGLFDVGADIGLPYHNEDFGQTLATYGVGDGPYLMLPILGPTNGRDLIGRLVDALADPVTQGAANDALIARQVAIALDTREQLLEVDSRLDESFDSYALLRTIYRQRRKSDIANGRLVVLKDDAEDDIFDSIED